MLSAAMPCHHAVEEAEMCENDEAGCPVSRFREVRSVTQDGKVRVDFMAQCKNALEVMFNWFDADNDGALDYEEFSSLFKFTENETISKEYFQGLQNAVSTNDQGSVTFEGFLDLYKISYSDLGVDMGDLSLWKDLHAFGFNADLVHKGDFPPRVVKKRNLFQVLGKQKETAKKLKNESSPIIVEAEPSSPQEVQDVTAPQPWDLCSPQAQNQTKSPPQGQGQGHQTIILVDDEPVETPTKVVPAAIGKRNAFSILGKKEKKEKQEKQQSGGVAGKSKSKQRAEKAVAQDFVTVEDEPTVVVVQVHDSPKVAQKEDVIDDVKPFFRPRGSKKQIAISDERDTGRSPWTLLEFPEQYAHVNCSKLTGELFSTDPGTDWESVGQINLDSSILSPFTLKNLLHNGANYVPRIEVPIHNILKVAGADELTENPIVRSIATGLPHHTLQQFAAVAQGNSGTREHELWVNKYQEAIWPVLLDSNQEYRIFEDWLRNWTVPPSSQLLPQGNSNSFLSEDFMCDDVQSNASWAGGSVSQSPVAAVLCGPSGVGKSSAAYSAALRFGYTVIESHPALQRSGQLMKQFFGEASQSRGIDSSRALNKSLILVDEGDIVFEEDKGFYTWLRSTLAESRCPVVITCNRVTEEMFHILHDSRARLHNITQPPREVLESILRAVSAVEGIEATTRDIEHLLEVKHGNLRSCLNHLQFCCGLSSLDGEIQHQDFLPGPVNEIQVGDCLDEYGIDPLLGESGILHAELQRLCDSSQSDGETLLNRVEYELPLVSAVEPNVGPESGGVEIYIVGKGFQQVDGSRCNTQVFIDNQECFSVEVISDSKIRCIAPPILGFEPKEDETNEEGLGPKEGDEEEEKKEENERSEVDKMGSKQAKELEPSKKSRESFESFSDDDVDDFVSKEKRKQSKRQESKEKSTHWPELVFRPTTLAQKLAVSRHWPKNVRVDVQFTDGRCVSSGENQLCAYNALFEYMPVLENRCFDECSTGNIPVQQVSRPLSESQQIDSLCDLKKMQTIEEVLSTVNTISCAPFARRKLVGFREEVDEVGDEYLLFPFVNGMKTSAGIRSVSYLVAGKIANPTFDVQQYCWDSSDTFGKRMLELQESQRLHFQDSLRIAESCLTSFSLGPSRATRLANNRYLHSSMLECVPFVLRMCLSEEEKRSQARSKRRFYHYFDRLPKSDLLIDCARVMNGRIFRRTTGSK